MNKRNNLRFGCIILILTLLLGALPVCALAEGGFNATVKVKKMKVYKDAWLTEYWGSLSKGTVVYVEDYSGSVALITYNGRSGYAAVSDMKAEKKSSSTASSETTKTEESSGTVTRTICKTRVYKKASLSSKYVTVAAGTEVTVLAVSGSCAKVKRNGNIGYMYTKHLEVFNSFDNSDNADDEEEEETKESSSTPSSMKEAISSGKYTTEQLCYMFLVKVSGYNTAAACGILANISAESSFNTACVGDSGKSYGICQWYSSRKTSMINWCNNNGYDYTSLLGQLYYLKYELENKYTMVHKYLKAVDNSSSGAYDAGYYFCYHFEAPANKESKAQSRGAKARDTYYQKYA